MKDGMAVLRGVEVYKGLGGAGGADAPYVTIASLKFDSVAVFEEALKSDAEAIMGDIPNFTNIEPVIQIEEQLIG